MPSQKAKDPSTARIDGRQARQTRKRTNARRGRLSAFCAEQPTIKERQASLGPKPSGSDQGGEENFAMLNAAREPPAPSRPNRRRKPAGLASHRQERNQQNPTPRGSLRGRSGQAKANEPASLRRQARSARRSSPELICRRLAEDRAKAAPGRMRGGLTRFFYVFFDV